MKLQTHVTLSTTEAEYVALSTTAKELIWFRNLEAAYGKPTVIHTKSKLFSDNQASLKLAESDDYRKRTHHIETQFHYVREKVEQGQIQTKYTPTHTNLADVMTKGLPLPAHARQIAGLGLQPATTKDGPN